MFTNIDCYFLCSRKNRIYKRIYSQIFALCIQKEPLYYKAYNKKAYMTTYSYMPIFKTPLLSVLFYRLKFQLHPF